MENGGNRSSTGSSSNGTGGSNTSHLNGITEHQIYATIQRKQPPFPPFGGGGGGTTGTSCSKGFDTIDRLKLFQVRTIFLIFSSSNVQKICFVCVFTTKSINFFHL